MKRFNRLLLAWLLLLALPLQGFAAVRMPLCVPAAPAQASAHGHGGAVGVAMPHGAASHDHEAMLRAQAAAHEDASDDGHGAKAGSCASCCIGAALAPVLPVPPPAQQPDFLPIPFRAGHLPSVDPALPERPPRHTLA